MTYAYVPPQSSTAHRIDVDVLIIGAGPVGLVLAVELARRAVSCRIVDMLPEPTTQSRAIAVHSRSLDHLEALDSLEAVMKRASVARGMRMHSEGRTIAQVPFSTVTAVHPYSAALAQTDTEAVLTERLNELEVVVERPVTFVGYDQNHDGVDVELSGPDGTTQRVRARYLVGADGARSTVRRQMGQKLEGSFAGEDFLLGDVEGDHDYDRSQFHTFFSPGETTGLLFPLPGNRVRVFAQLPPRTDPDRPVTVDWLQQALDERGIRLRITRTHWLTRFEIKHGQVPHYRDGRVFIAGDAAHIHSPAGALGMNTGIQDAVNLGWKLAEALRNNDPALLESYELERHPIAAAVIVFTNRLSQVGTLSNPVAQQARNLLLQLGLKLPLISGRIAGTVEQQNVHYRQSPIVGGQGGTLEPGDFLHLPETVMAQILAKDPRHQAIVLPGPGGAFTPVLPAWITECTVSEGDVKELRHSTGLLDGGVVIVRPDGYIGHIGPDVHFGVDEYGSLIGCVAS